MKVIRSLLIVVILFILSIYSYIELKQKPLPHPLEYAALSTRDSLGKIRSFIRSQEGVSVHSIEKFIRDNHHCENLTSMDQTDNNCSVTVIPKDGTLEPKFGGFLFNSETMKLSLNLPQYSSKQENLLINRKEIVSRNGGVPNLLDEILFSDPRNW